MFDFVETWFSVSFAKEATARIALFKDLRTCPQVFTLESTFAGFDKGPLAGQAINQGSLEKMGHDLLRCLLV